MESKITVEVDDAAVREWASVAIGSRMLQHCMRGVGDPRKGSPFAQVNDMYPFEKVSDRSRAYLAAALEHLIFWADIHAPLKFHPEQRNEVTLRPGYTLARAALEASAQAVWMMNTTDPVECVRRHLSLIRWDLQEFRKSLLDDSAKERAKGMEAELLRRVSGVFDDSQVRTPNGYLEVIRAACAAKGLDLDPEDAERVWRAASGAAHGKYWPTVALQEVLVGEEYEPGHFRSIQVPDVDGITEVLKVAHAVTNIGVLRFLDYSGVDIAGALEAARDWAFEVLPLKPGVDRDAMRADPGWFDYGTLRKTEAEG